MGKGTIEFDDVLDVRVLETEVIIVDPHAKSKAEKAKIGERVEAYDGDGEVVTNEDAKVIAKVPGSKVEMHTGDNWHFYVGSGKPDEAGAKVEKMATEKRDDYEVTYEDELNVQGMLVAGLTDGLKKEDEVGGVIEL